MKTQGHRSRERDRPLEPDRPFAVDLMADVYPAMDDDLSPPHRSGVDRRTRTAADFT
jgi:hypothetical protein